MYTITLGRGDYEQKLGTLLHMLSDKICLLIARILLFWIIFNSLTQKSGLFDPHFMGSLALQLYVTLRKVYLVVALKKF